MFNNITQPYIRDDLCTGVLDQNYKHTRRKCWSHRQRRIVDGTTSVHLPLIRVVSILTSIGFTSGFLPPARISRLPSKQISTSTIERLYQQQGHLDSSDEYYVGDGSLVSDTFRERYSDTIPTWLLDKCNDCGWTYPTRIQEKVLDTILTEHRTDVIVQSETGSGKTLAFLLPCMASIDASRSAVQALIVVPTRELGLQISRVAKRLASSSGGNKIMVMSVLQGSQNRRQRAWAWAEPPHIVIGTPEELCLMIRNGGIKRYNSIKYLIVDEVDACLLNNNGNVASGQLQFSGTPLHELLSKYLSPTYDDGKESIAMETDSAAATNGPMAARPMLKSRITVFCSATIPQHRYFAKQCVQNQWMLQTPAYVSLRAGSQHLPAQIKHGYIVAGGSEKKLAALRRIIKKIMVTCRSSNEPNSVLVFSDNNRPMEEMAKIIAKDVDGFYWSEQTVSSSAPTQHHLSHPAVVSVLRYEDSLSQRAVAMDALCGTFRKNDIVSHSGDNVVSSTDTNSSNILLRILLSSDLAARGLDIVDITHVIQVDLPESADAYVHRAGRTGRFGRNGQVMSIITPEQEFVLERLTNKLQIDITCVARQETIEFRKKAQPSNEVEQ